MGFDCFLLGGTPLGGARGFVKILAGILLMIAGVAWYFVKVPVLSGVLSTGALVHFWRSLLVTFAGIFGALIFLTGLIVTWISYDEYKST